MVTIRDLAKIYQCKNETKEINQAVNRNPIKFPNKYCWILSDKEVSVFLVTIGDQKIEKRGGRYKNPRVFTEQAVAMLATILRTPEAIQVSLAIIDAFVAMRHYLIQNKDVYKSINNINNRLLEHDDKINYLFSKFNKKENLYLKGETFDSYLNIVDILNNATKEIIIIDSYADIKSLDLIRNIKVDIVLITKNSNRLSNIEIDKYNKQYNNLKVIRNNTFHDRYLIIDRKEIYICGSSINTLGDKTFMIIKLDDNNIKKTLLTNINNII